MSPEELEQIWKAVQSFLADYDISLKQKQGIYYIQNRDQQFEQFTDLFQAVKTALKDAMTEELSWISWTGKE